MSWQDVTQSSLCSGVKECGTKCAHNILFPKSSFRIWKTTVLGMFKGSAIILYATRRSFLTKPATAATFTSVQVDFGQPPLSSSSNSSLQSQNREHRLQIFDRFTASFPKPFAPKLLFLSQTDRLWNEILWLLCSFLPSIMYKENWLYKISYN